MRHQYALESVVATVDAQHGLRGAESIQQAAAADVLVVTKVDLADGAAVEAELRRLNPVADIVKAVSGDVDPDVLLGARRSARGDSPEALPEPGHAHEDAVRAVSLTLEGPVDWLGFGVWLTMLLHARGRDILRVKGLLDTGGGGPLLLNAVQHVVHPPEHLPAWPDDDRRSRLVVIGRGFEAEELDRSLRSFATT